MKSFYRAWRKATGIGCLIISTGRYSISQKTSIHIDKLRKSIQSDRRVTLREIVEYIFGLIPFFKSREELLDEEFDKFIADCKPGEKDDIRALKYFFKSYVTDGKLREIIDNRKYTELNVNPSFTTKDLKAVPERWRLLIPEYVKDYVPLNKFIN